MLASARSFGYVFNPLSVFWCIDHEQRVRWAILEIHNTYGDRHAHVIHLDDLGKSTVQKHFYVSPFFALDLAFDFKLRVPGEQLDIYIDDREGARPVLLTALTGRRVPLTDANLARLTLKYPLVTLRVITLIHWHALKLWWKNVPWHRKAANPQLQRGVFNAPESLRGQTREGKG